MERKLATIRKINKLQPIDGADMIEVAVIDGWKVVVKKGEFQEGDWCVYFEIDSFLPIKPEFEFLRKSSYKKDSLGNEGFRLKTIRLRQQLSQGLALPLTSFPDYNRSVFYGLDVTDDLGIIKYEPPIPANLAGTVKGMFPSFANKTDETRIQNLTSEFEEWKNEKLLFEVTEKLDGSSCTMYIRDGEFGVCSRNLDLQRDENNSFWKVAIEHDVENKLRSISDNIVIQGELIGEGIQGNPYNIKGQDFKVFNVYDINTGQYYPIDATKNIAYKLGFNSVPLLHVITLRQFDDIDDLLEFAEGKSLLNNQIEREGIVFKTADRSVHFKVISNKFLLKQK